MMSNEKALQDSYGDYKYNSEFKKHGQILLAFKDLSNSIRLILCIRCHILLDTFDSTQKYSEDEIK